MLFNHFNYGNLNASIPTNKKIIANNVASERSCLQLLMFSVYWGERFLYKILYTSLLPIFYLLL